MVVISTNNGSRHLKNLIDSLERYGPFDEEYLIVDTQSTDLNALIYLDSLMLNQKLNIKIGQTPYAGFDTGAIIWAFHHYKRKDYIFLHDSFIIKESNWLNKFRDALTTGTGLVAWQLFDYPCYNDSATAQFVLDSIGVNDHRQKGIFGPCFYTNLKTMELFNEKGLLKAIPANKKEAMAMELGWCAIAYAANVPMYSLYAHDWNKVVNDEYPLFTKIFGGRKDNEHMIKIEKDLISGISSTEQGMLLQMLAQTINAKTIVEVGVAWGGTTKYLCEAATITGGHCHGIDYWNLFHNADANLRQDMYSSKDATEHTLKNLGYSNFTLYECDTSTPLYSEIINSLPLIDFAFIDANHRYDFVKNDFNVIASHLSATGTIVLHDTKICDGPRKLVLELRNELKGFDILDLPYGEFGITIFSKRDKSSQYPLTQRRTMTMEEVHEMHRQEEELKCK
jgi:predicted O-methyltransferase YrrM